ncbi:MAG: hypothetical protein QM737_10095 [Ferruginibacter sp.]
MPNTKWPNSKELYMMNGGNKLYIYKDGFGDIYNATVEEEREWDKEIIANYLQQLDTETNSTGLKFAIEGLLFHNYPGLETLLIQKIEPATPIRKIVIATALWKIYKYKKSYEIIYEQYLRNHAMCLDEVFFALIEFKNSKDAFSFLLGCLEGNDEKLFSKAHTTISMWAYTGLPDLRENGLLERLGPANRNTKELNLAIEEFKTIISKNDQS